MPITTIILYVIGAMLVLGFIFSRKFRNFVTTLFFISVAGAVFYYTRPVAKAEETSAGSTEPTPATTITPFPVQDPRKPSYNPADYPLNITTPCLVGQKFPAKVLQWCGLITYYSVYHGIEPNQTAAVVFKESSGNPEPCDIDGLGYMVIDGIHICGSKSGAIGLMQIMPSDGISGAKYTVFVDRLTALEYLNPEINIATGTQMLASRGAATNFNKALLSYVGGDQSYADKVIAIYNEYR